MAMATVEGAHAQGAGERVVRYRADYDVVGNAIHYKATFPGCAASSAREGQFDFDPSKLDAAAAVDAFLRNHIEKSDFDVAP